MITFIWPLAFLLLPLPYVLRRYLKPVAAGEAGALRVPFFQRFSQQQMSAQVAPSSQVWRKIALFVVWVFLITALARPAFVGPAVPLPAEGRDVMMAIDLSGSMQEDDFALGGRRVTRLDVVKETADEFLTRRSGDRVGLVLFSDRAYLQAPLTFDREVVQELLKQAEVGLTGQKTAIGDAIAVSVKRLKDRPEQGRVLILLTDGASNAGVIEPLKAAELAKDLGIRIYTIGVGSKAVAMNTPFGRQLVNPSQDLDEGTLTAIADATGGKYFRATDVQGLATIYQEIDKLEPVSGDPIKVRPEVALYFWPAGIAFVLAMLFALMLSIPSLISSMTPVRREIAGELK